jgi:hypothetical protein
MNCCDANGHCNQGRDCPVRNGAQPRHPFAPGTIDAGDPPLTWRGLRLALVLVAACAALAGMLGFAAGYLSFPGMFS